MSLAEALARMEAIGARVASLQAALASTPASAAAAGWHRALSLDVAASGGRGWPWVAPGPASPGGAAQDVSPPVLAPSPRGLVYPLAARGKIIGLPYQGTHAQLPGWESRNAVDIAVPYGTPVYAVADGVIGDQIGPLRSSDPRLQGERLHLIAEDNEYYYAHLSQIVVLPGQRVRAGDLLGYSGAANGSEHLHLAAREGSPAAALSALL